jgi:predicted chitinase
MATLEQLAEIFPHAKHDNLAKYCDALNAAMAEFEIDTPKREACSWHSAVTNPAAFQL